jgi:hypothetical protein
MNTRRWNYTLAAALAAGSLSLAWAVQAPHQTSAGSKGDFTPADEAKSTMPVPNPPIASAATDAKMKSADKRLTDTVVKALNADPSLQGAKVTVQASNGELSLSGSAPDSAKADKIRGIASKHAKSGKVSDSLQVAGG